MQKFALIGNSYYNIYIFLDILQVTINSKTKFFLVFIDIKSLFLKNLIITCNIYYYIITLLL
jgi:hypothetical protein